MKLSWEQVSSTSVSPWTQTQFQGTCNENRSNGKHHDSKLGKINAKHMWPEICQEEITCKRSVITITLWSAGMDRPDESRWLGHTCKVPEKDLTAGSIGIHNDIIGRTLRDNGNSTNPSDSKRKANSIQCQS